MAYSIPLRRALLILFLHLLTQPALANTALKPDCATTSAALPTIVSTCRPTSFLGTFVSVLTITSKRVTSYTVRDDCPAATSDIAGCPTLCNASIIKPTLSILGFCTSKRVSGAYCQECLPFCSTKDVTAVDASSAISGSTTSSSEASTTSMPTPISQAQAGSQSINSVDPASTATNCARPTLDASNLSADKSCPSDRQCPWRCTDRSFGSHPLYYCADCNLYNVSPVGFSYCTPCGGF